MYLFLISITVGLLVGLGLGLSETLGYGWSTFHGVLAFGLTQFIAGRVIQKRVKAVMDSVQAVLLEGQKRLQAKMARWQMRPPGSIQAMQAEMARDQKVFVTATAQFQLHWMTKDFKKVDELMPKALFFDPTMTAMKLARMYMLDKPTEEIGKVYKKGVARLRYNQNVLLAATYSWILVQRKDIDGAFKTLNRALEKSDNETLKANREHLANNRVAHFTNAALGEQWYALMLEEPRIRQQRPRMQWR